LENIARSHVAACGIRVVASALPSTRAAVAAISAQLRSVTLQHVIAFFSTEHDVDVLVEEFNTALPDVPVSGCSTSGEIGPLGMMQGGIVVIAFPEEGFRVLSEIVPGADQAGVETASEIARRMKLQINLGPNRFARDNVFAISLIDGLSNQEESLIAALHWSLGEIELIGGSAGDGLAFRHTSLVHRNTPLRGGAVLFVIESHAPFKVFKTQNFEPTSIKLVVTDADVEKRIVRELNAELAAREYAAAIGLMPDDLGPFSFASYPLVVKVGGDYYCRSIRNMNPDGSLSFFCAIDEGLVFTVARPRDMLSDTQDVLDDLDKRLGGMDLVIGFDCILRRLDAESRQIRHKVEELYQKYGVTGFHTYGEQYNAMHLNQTLTGIAFGKPEEAVSP
jgi:hypothetical protein